MAKYNLYLNGENHVHISDGNKKLGNGVFNVSLLPSDKPLTKNDGTQLVNICGTCGGVVARDARTASPFGCGADCSALSW
jgi:hypothetical protein